MARFEISAIFRGLESGSRIPFDAPAQSGECGRAGERVMKTREGEIGLRIRVMGRVQGVGFRPWACTLAREIGVCGRIWNDAEGVTVEAFGSPDQLSLLRVLLARPTLQQRFGPLPVALSGTCFQNEHLVTGLVRALGPGHRVLRDRLVPPGDGGVALGQASIADLRVCGAASS